MAEKPTILIVDDEPFNIKILVDLLHNDYTTIIAKNGAQALQRAVADPSPDLILLDIMMPDMDGYEVCERLKQLPSCHDIPVIFISAMNDTGDETHGLDLGAVDYIIKPISPPIVKARIRNHLALKQARSQLANQNEILEQRVTERTRELEVTQDITILCMTTLAETRDNETGNHIRRTQHYIRALARHLHDHPRFSSLLGEEKNIELLFKSAPLHDIGKVGIPDKILLKPGKLTDAEFTIMKRHAEFGYQAILNAESSLEQGINHGPEKSFLRFAREISYSHHEKWNGGGYPQGLKEEEIPISARLMAVADVYDALISRRVYKPPFSHDKAVEIIQEGRGIHFDPDIVDAFTAVEAEFIRIAAQFNDE